MSKEKYTRKCEECNVTYQLNKKSLKRELRYKKGEVVTDSTTYKDVICYGLFRLKTKVKVKTDTYTFMCKKDLYDTFFVCPICKELNYIKYNDKPWGEDSDWSYVSNKSTVRNE